MPPFRPFLNRLAQSTRQYSSHIAPRHLLSIADLSPSEFTKLVQNAASHKHTIKAGSASETFRTALRGQTVGMTFNKRSTRTRISTEGAVVALGGHPMFLGNNDIQLGVKDSIPAKP